MPLTGGIFWEDHGGGGRPLLLSAGLGGSARYWAPNIAELAIPYRVLGYDHRGTGRSERTVEGDLTVETLADDMLAVLDAAGVERATVVGHAAGGLAAMALALKAPERLSGLVVVNGWSRLDPHTARCFDARLALLTISPRAFLHAQPLFLYPPEWISAHGEELAAEEEQLLGQFPGAEMVQRRIAAVRRFNIDDRLGDIRLPTAFFVSRDDMLVPPGCSRRLADGVAGAHLISMDHGGHACTVTRPQEFNRWLRAWLERE